MVEISVPTLPQVGSVLSGKKAKAKKKAGSTAVQAAGSRRSGRRKRKGTLDQKR